MEGIVRLPLFLLNTVLFPGQMLPLHIFEPHYRQMINTCLAGDRSFGVVFIRSGGEVGGPTQPHRVGTLARIVGSDRLQDGRMNIVTAGEARFRILQLHYDQPYLTADVVEWPWVVEEAAYLSAWVEQVSHGLKRYLTALSHSLDDLALINEMPRQPITLGCLAAIALQISQPERQDLLVAPTLAALLDKELELLQREIRTLRITGGVATRLISTGNEILSDN